MTALFSCVRLIYVIKICFLLFVLALPCIRSGVRTHVYSARYRPLSHSCLSTLTFCEKTNKNGITFLTRQETRTCLQTVIAALFREHTVCSGGTADRTESPPRHVENRSRVFFIFYLLILLLLFWLTAALAALIYALGHYARVRARVARTASVRAFEWEVWTRGRTGPAGRPPRNSRWSSAVKVDLQFSSVIIAARRCRKSPGCTTPPYVSRYLDESGYLSAVRPREKNEFSRTETVPKTSRAVKCRREPARTRWNERRERKPRRQIKKIGARLFWGKNYVRFLSAPVAAFIRVRLYSRHVSRQRFRPFGHRPDHRRPVVDIARSVRETFESFTERK